MIAVLLQVDLLWTLAHQAVQHALYEFQPDLGAAALQLAALLVQSDHTRRAKAASRVLQALLDTEGALHSAQVPAWQSCPLGMHTHTYQQMPRVLHPNQ